MAMLREGDVVVFAAIDRLARNLRHLLTITDRIHERGGRIRSLSEPYDTSTAAGELVFQMLGSVAQFERKRIKERAAEGLKLAMANGKHCGDRSNWTNGKLTNWLKCEKRVLPYRTFHGRSGSLDQQSVDIWRMRGTKS